MESVTIKMDKEMVFEMEKAMKPFYATKTEFIREAIRQKILQAKYPNVDPKWLKYFGSAKSKTSDEELHQAREEVFRKLAKKHGIVLD